LFLLLLFWILSHVQIDPILVEWKQRKEGREEGTSPALEHQERLRCEGGEKEESFRQRR
jgi:hypothetical protein